MEQESHFSHNVRFLRVSKRYTQREMGEKLNCNTSTWAAYEEGRSEPSYERLILISEIFEVSIDDLIRKNLIHFNKENRALVSEFGRLLTDLLCIAHRDGGHYINEVGIDKATEDAKNVYYHLRQDNEDFREAMKRFVEKVDRDFESVEEMNKILIQTISIAIIPLRYFWSCYIGSVQNESHC